MNETEMKKIMEKTRKKIAIDKLKNDNIKIGISKMKILKMVATFTMTIGLTVGVVYAGTVVYEKIWKEPTKIDIYDQEITEEVKDNSISEEEAKNIAINKLKELGFNEEITGTDNYKNFADDTIMYRFINKDEYSISINGANGQFYEIWSNSKLTKQEEEARTTKEGAIETAKMFYKKFGHKEEEYELVSLHSNYSEEADKSYLWYAEFQKKYDGLKNRFQSISIGFYPEINKIYYYRVNNSKFENNPIEIDKEKAIEIAKQEDSKIETPEIKSINAELRIEKMNGDAYARINNTEQYYKPMMETNVPNEERLYYKTDAKIRKVWVVSIDYNTENTDIITEVAKGAFSYYIDCTTGEVIGGNPGNYFNSEKWNDNDNYLLDK